MARYSQRLVLPLLAALIGAFGLTASPPSAQAVEPITTKTQILWSGGERVGERIYVTALVTSSAGIPAGSVVFTGIGDGTPVPLSRSGTATVSAVLTSTAPFEVGAAFTGTAGFADSGTTRTVVPLSKAYLHAEPTVLSLVGAKPRLTLTMSAYVRNVEGGPIAGRSVTFTLLAPLPDFPERNRGLTICTAVSNADGLARCGVVGVVGSAFSILTGGAFASLTPSVPSAIEHVRLPVVLR